MNNPYQSDFCGSYSAPGKSLFYDDWLLEGAESESVFRGYRGIGPERGTKVEEEDAYEYALDRCLHGSEAERIEFREMLASCFYCGDPIGEEQKTTAGFESEYQQTLNRCLYGEGEEREEFPRILVEWFYSGNWVEEVK